MYDVHYSVDTYEVHNAYNIKQCLMRFTYLLGLSSMGQWSVHMMHKYYYNNICQKIKITTGKQIFHNTI